MNAESPLSKFYVNRHGELCVNERINHNFSVVFRVVAILNWAFILERTGRKFHGQRDS